MSTYLTENGWKDELKKTTNKGVASTGVSEKLRAYESTNNGLKLNDDKTFEALQKALANLANVAQEQSTKFPNHKDATAYLKKIVETVKARVTEVQKQQQTVHELKEKSAKNIEGPVKELTAVQDDLNKWDKSYETNLEELKSVEQYVKTQANTISQNKDKLDPEQDIPHFQNLLKNLEEKSAKVHKDALDLDERMKSKLDPIYKKAESVKDDPKVKPLLETAKSSAKELTTNNLEVRNRITKVQSLLKLLIITLNEADKKNRKK